MPPQPLSSVKSDARIIPNPGVLRAQPTLAPLIADVISLWSHIEANLATVLARMLVASAQAGMAMYQAVRSPNAQFDMLKALARETLAPAQLPIFEAAMRLVRRFGRQRDRIAHWLWAYSPDLPDALLLIDPNRAAEYHASLAEHLMQFPHPAGTVNTAPVNATQFPALNPAIVLVYRDKDFQEVIYDLNTVWNLTVTLIGCVTRGHPLGHAQWQLLATQPRMAEELSRKS